MSITLSVAGCAMKAVTFRSEIHIHAAGADLLPLCGQTDAGRRQDVQQQIGVDINCERCKAILLRQDKNSPENRTRRRFLAARQALKDGRVGVEFFERRTPHAKARARAATMVEREIVRLQALATALRNTPPPQTEAKGEA